MIRLASIGTATISAQFVAASRRVPAASFVSAYSRDADRADEFARANRIPSSTSDLDGLLSSDDIDAVYIATPNSVHFEQALAAIRAGKHVLVEKPATTDAASFVQLVAAARAHGVVLLEAMRNAYDPGVAEIGQRLPLIGTPRYASFAFCQRSSRYDAFLAGEQFNVFDPSMAGGALLDLGVYCLSAAVSLFGTPTGVTGRSVALANGVDGSGVALLEYPGMIVEVVYSKASHSTLPSEIQGERGTLTIDHIANPRTIRLEPVAGPIREWTIEKPPGDLGNLHHALDRFTTIVQAGGDLSADHARTLSTLQLTDELRRD